MNQTILVVEDDIDIAKSLAELFGEEGYTAVVAENGRKALDYLLRTEELPCLILLDIMMPVMDGVEFAAELKKDPRLCHIRVVVMTADARIEARRHQIRAEAFIRKPLDIVVMLNTVQRLCA